MTTAKTPGSTPGKTPGNVPGLTAGRLKELDQTFTADPQWRRMQNAVTQVSIPDLTLSRDVLFQTDHTFSIHLDDWTVTNQKSSGRCWMFAALNVFRQGAMKKMKVRSFEFSQSYPMFWDKLERANYFLENIIATADQPEDSRELWYLLESPLDDGGQWNMFVNLIHKYGAVPKSAMPETESSSNTGRMNSVLREQLRQGALHLRTLHAGGKKVDDLRRAKHEILAVIYRILRIHLGSPPTKVQWQWTDKDNKFHRDRPMTPQQFAAKYITLPLDQYACLVHDPRHPYGKPYTVRFLGNIVGGDPVVYLNVDIETMKRLAMRTLKEGQVVWFGCDVGKHMRDDPGIWDAHLYEVGPLYGAEFRMNKAERLRFRQTLMTHAMVFTGVDVLDDRPRRWRVENSVSADKGQKGFYTMNDNWFDQYVFEISAHKKHLPVKLQQALKRKPIELPPWDPMGSLARSSG